MRVALVQSAYQGSKETMREHLAQKAKEAKEQGAELICFSELHDSHYFCINESVESFDLAEEFEEDCRYYGELARRLEVVLVASLFEKRTEGLYHNSAVVFETDGSEAGRYRKMHIPDDPGFYEKFYFTPGDIGFEPIETSVGKLGVLICWDQWFPEAARLMALKGADLLIYPTAIGWFPDELDEEKARELESWVTIQQSHAVANGIPVVSINRVGFERDESGVLEGIAFWGNSFVADSGGTLIYRANGQESLGIVDIDLGLSRRYRRIWPFLRDRRIDAYDEITKRFID